MRRALEAALRARTHAVTLAARDRALAERRQAEAGAQLRACDDALRAEERAWHADAAVAPAWLTAEQSARAAARLTEATAAEAAEAARTAARRATLAEETLRAARARARAKAARSARRRDEIAAADTGAHRPPANTMV